MNLWDDVVTGVAIFACLGLSGLMIMAADRSIAAATRRLTTSASASPRLGVHSTRKSKGRASALTESVATATPLVKPMRLDTMYDLAISTIPQRIVEDIERSLKASLSSSKGRSLEASPTRRAKRA